MPQSSSDSIGVDGQGTVGESGIEIFQEVGVARGSPLKD